MTGCKTARMGIGRHELLEQLDLPDLAIPSRGSARRQTRGAAVQQIAAQPRQPFGFLQHRGDAQDGTKLAHRLVDETAQHVDRGVGEIGGHEADQAHAVQAAELRHRQIGDDHVEAEAPQQRLGGLDLPAGHQLEPGQPQIRRQRIDHDRLIVEDQDSKHGFSVPTRDGEIPGDPSAQNLPLTHRRETGVATTDQCAGG